MADKKIKVQLDVDTNIEPTIANLKALKRQLRETAAGSADFNKVSQQIRDMDDALKDANATSDDFLGYLENASGPLGMLGKGIRGAEKNFSSFNAILKASVIGLIVAAVGGLVAAFSKSETAMKKLQPLFIGLEKILGGIFKAFEPLLDAFIELATSALPYITKGIGMFYSGLFSLFTLVKNVGVSVGKILKGVFTLDFDALKEGAAGIKDAFTSVGKTFNATYKRFEEGTKEQTSTEKVNAAERKKIAEEEAKRKKELAEKALQERLKRMETEDKLDEALLEKLKQEALAVAETEQQKLDVEKSFTEKAYELRLKDIADKQSLYKKDSIEYKDLQAQKLKLESDYIAQTEGFATKQKEITEKNNKDLLDAEISSLNLRKAKGEVTEAEYQQSLFEIKKNAIAKDEILKNQSLANDSAALDTALLKNKEYVDALVALETYKNEQNKKSAEEERNILLSDLQSKFELLDAENERIDGDFVADLQRYAEQRAILAEQEAIELQNEELTQFQKTEIRKKYADARKQISDNEIATEKAAMEAKHEINMAYLGLFEQFGSVLGQLAGKNKALAIAGVVIQQAAAIGQIVSQTAIANAKARAISPLTGGLPWVAINRIAAALSIASTIAAGVKSVQQINQAASASGVNGGGGGSASTSGANLGPAPTAPTLPTTTAPQIQTTGGTNPNQQIASTIATATSKPIRAYVVSGDVSSQQALDRRTSRAATFSAG